MEIKLAKYISQFLVDHDVTDGFMITGGGAMHLNDAFGHQEGLKLIYNHHEQACAIGAEGYARYTGKMALCSVTSGPGGTNAITGVLGAWQDSIPMLVISGQVKRETTTWSTDVPLRQLGDQEFQIVDTVKNMTKYAVMITEPKDIRYHLEKAFYLANTGRKGPVWLDIPLDVQAAKIDTDELRSFDPSEFEGGEGKDVPKSEWNHLIPPTYDASLTGEILEKIKAAKKPVILAGTAIRQAGAYKEFLACIEKLNIPVVTAWNAHDLLPFDHELFAGKPGTVGTRGGNFVVQNADLLLVLGCRMNIRMISYNRLQFGKNAYKIIVDIDENELRKPTVKADMPVHADVKDVMAAIAESDYAPSAEVKEFHENWLKWCRETDKKYPATLPSYFESEMPLNPYACLTEFFRTLPENEAIICGNGGACVITFQTSEIKKGQRLFTNSGCAAMGYGFPASIGVALARKGERTLCVDGDGSFQMNLQELQTVVYNNLNLKIFYLNNNGYHSIRQTQRNSFTPPLVGVCDGNGLSFPDAEKIAYAYGIPYIRIEKLSEVQSKVKEALEIEGPAFIEMVVDENQNFEPKLSSKVMPDGTITSPELDDMFPFLSREEYESNRFGQD